MTAAASVFVDDAGDVHVVMDLTTREMRLLGWATREYYRQHTEIWRIDAAHTLLTKLVMLTNALNRFADSEERRH